MDPEDFGGDMEELAARAIRPPMRLSAEDLVASELASAILSEPLSKIRHVCEALMLLDRDELERAEITEEEAREARELYSISLSLLNAYIDKEVDPASRVIVERYAMVPWGFPMRCAGERLLWLGTDFSPVANNPRAAEGWDRMSRFEKVYFLMSQAELSMDSYRGAVVRFVDYAMPKAAVLMKKIIRLVTPDSYREALKILRGGRRGKT